MTEQFFDHVMLGKGDAAKVAETCGMDLDLLLHIRNDVVYWYPLDVNLGGKEHMTVHFPAFLKNHVAILPKELWPKGIFVNWYVTGKLGKILKSKGGAEPIPGAAGRFGVDALRLYYAHIAVPFVDVEWDESIIENYASRIEKVLRSVDDLHALNGCSESTVDRWLLSRMNNRIIVIQKAMEQYDLRKMANEVYFETFNDIKWYIRRGGDNCATVAKFLNMWIRMMTPITPHIAEELWEKEGNEGLVSSAEYPSPDNKMQDARSEASENYLSSVMTDTNEILKVTGISPKRIFIYTSAQWKRDVLSMGLQMMSSGTLSIPALTKAVMTNDDLKKHGKEAADFAKKTAEELMKRSETNNERSSIDEYAFLSDAAKFLSKELNCEVSVFSADEKDLVDPQKKARVAQPMRPAIYIE